MPVDPVQVGDVVQQERIVHVFFVAQDVVLQDPYHLLRTLRGVFLSA